MQFIPKDALLKLSETFHSIGYEVESINSVFDDIRLKIFLMPNKRKITPKGRLAVLAEALSSANYELDELNPIYSHRLKRLSGFELRIVKP
jgi:hypothetical protein